MTRMWLLLPVALLVMLALTASVAPASTTGTLEITTNTTLTEDHYGEIVIGADNITLDCAGHSVTKIDGYDLGVKIKSYTGVTVKNCTVSGFDGGGFVVYTSGNKLVNNTATANPGPGFQIQSASGNTLVGNKADNNNHGGFKLNNAFLNVLRGNSASGNVPNGFGLLDGSSNNLLTGNSATANDQSGFYISGGSDNTLRANSAKQNGRGNEPEPYDFSRAGFLLAGASWNTLTGNVANDNYAGFILIEGSSQNRLSDNNAVNNGIGLVGGYGSGWGFLISFDCNENTLDHNVATNNDDFGFVANSNGNVFSQNTANNNASGFGVDGGSYNMLTGNVANHNHDWGFAFLGPSTNNTVQNSLAHNNGAYDGYDANRPANTWTNNNFGTTNPPGL